MEIVSKFKSFRSKNVFDISYARPPPFCRVQGWRGVSKGVPMPWYHAHRSRRTYRVVRVYSLGANTVTSCGAEGNHPTSVLRWFHPPTTVNYLIKPHRKLQQLCWKSHGNFELIIIYWSNRLANVMDTTYRSSVTLYNHYYCSVWYFSFCKIGAYLAIFPTSSTDPLRELAARDGFESRTVAI